MKPDRITIKKKSQRNKNPLLIHATIYSARHVPVSYVCSHQQDQHPQPQNDAYWTDLVSRKLQYVVWKSLEISNF